MEEGLLGLRVGEEELLGLEGDLVEGEERGDLPLDQGEGEEEEEGDHLQEQQELPQLVLQQQLSAF